MLKRSFNAPLFLSHWSSCDQLVEKNVGANSVNKVSPSVRSAAPKGGAPRGALHALSGILSTAVGPPQPIDEVDKQRLVKLSDPQEALDSSLNLAERSTNLKPSESQCLGHANPEEDEGDIIRDNRSRTEQVVQKQPSFSQHRLRQVERQLRSSLNLSTIFGSTVVETADLFQARQVSLLQYAPSEQTWQSVAQFCENQSLAWRPAFSISQAEFPVMMRHLKRGQSLQLSAANRTPVMMPSPLVESDGDFSATSGVPQGLTPGDATTDTQLMAEMNQWLACWPGSWLLVPIKGAQPARYHHQGVGHSARGVSVPQGALSSRLTSDPLSLLTDEESGHWGVMVLCLSGQTVWSDAGIAATQSIAIELALAMGQAQQYQELIIANQELQKLALSDGLTCLANRRRFDEHLADEWQRLARDKQPLSLILCDLDHFKRYNDSFGHPAGDRCLIRVARALLNGPQRPADLVARYGGEEFAVILPNTDTHGAWRIAKKIHDSIRALKIAHAPDNEEPYVTVTMGVSTVIPGHDTTPQMLVQASDLALYHAKQQGRNRTYVNAHYNTVNPDRGLDSTTPSDTQPKMTPPEESV